MEESKALEWLSNKYLDTVKRGKPNLRLANQLKLIIDVVQVYHEVINK